MANFKIDKDAQEVIDRVRDMKMQGMDMAQTLAKLKESYFTDPTSPHFKAENVADFRKFEIGLSLLGDYSFDSQGNFIQSDKFVAAAEGSSGQKWRIKDRILNGGQAVDALGYELNDKEKAARAQPEPEKPADKPAEKPQEPDTKAQAEAEAKAKASAAAEARKQAELEKAARAEAAALQKTESSKNAKELAESLGVSEMDLTHRKPGVPLKTSNGMTLELDQNGTLNIEMKDKHGGHLSLEVSTKNYTPTKGSLSIGGNHLTMTDPDELRQIAGAGGKLRDNKATSIGEGVAQTLRDNGHIKNGENASDWLHRKHVEHYDKAKHDPIHYDAPPHLKNPTPEQVLDYHLSSFKKATDPKTGELVYSYVDADKKKLEIRASKDGPISEVTLDGKPFPPTMETNHVLIESARHAKTYNSSIMGEMDHRLANELRPHYQTGTSSYDWANKAQETYEHYKEHVTQLAEKATNFVGDHMADVKSFVADHTDDLMGKEGAAITKKLAGRFGGHVVGAVTNTAIGAATGASKEEIAAGLVPGGGAALALSENKPAEAVFSAIEEIPVAGGIVSEVGRSLAHSAGYAETAEPGVLENVGQYLGNKAYDLTHPSPTFNAMAANPIQAPTPSAGVDMSALQNTQMLGAEPTPTPEPEQKPQLQARANTSNKMGMGG